MFHKIYLCKFSQISDLFLTEVHIFYSCRCIYLTDTLAVTRIAVKSSGLAPGVVLFFIRCRLRLLFRSRRNHLASVSGAALHRGPLLTTKINIIIEKREKGHEEKQRKRYRKNREERHKKDNGRISAG